MSEVTTGWERHAEYAGSWWTRKVKLAEDEPILRTAFSSRLGFLGSFAAGILWLTTDRIIFTPSPFIGQLPMSWTRWVVEKQRFVSVKEQRRWFGGWELRLEVVGDRARFMPSAKNRGWRAQRETTQEWLSEIDKWANS